MLHNRKKYHIFSPRHFYTTRDIMEITRQRRLKELENKQALDTQDLNPRFIWPETDVLQNIEELSVSSVKEVKVEAINSKNFLPANAITGLLMFILYLTAFFSMFFFKFPESWVNTVASKLNDWIVYGSFFALSIFQMPCTLEGGVLNSHHYKIALQGDLLAFYSIDLLIAFAAIFAFVQKTSWINRAGIFIALVPLAIMANICRVLLACGLPLNYGTAWANLSFNGVLVGVVFIFIVSGLIFIASLLTAD